MRKLFILSLLFVYWSVCLNAQNPSVTTFMGIPVDGSKQEMISRLKSKGFKESTEGNGGLSGEFNGRNVNLNIVTYHDKVYRIVVSDDEASDERSIQIRFNNLCSQFEKNERYISPEDYRIPDDEDIAIQSFLYKKRYQAVFYQIPDSEEFVKNYLLVNMIQKYSLEELGRLHKERKEEIADELRKALLDACYKMPVWFMISGDKDEYRIVMYYDNEYNRANGEDL